MHVASVVTKPSCDHGAVELLLEVGRPRHWLDQVLTPQDASVRMDAKTPTELREELAPFVRASRGGSTMGWITTRRLDADARSPLADIDELQPRGWVIEFAFELVHPLKRALALAPRTLVRVESVESRTRAFLDFGLRGVEQWSCAGFPDVVVTLGQRPARLP